VTRIMHQDCYYTVYRHFTKSSPLSAYFTVPDRSLFIYSEIYSLFYGSGHTVTSSLTSSPVANVCRGGAQIIVAPLCWSARAYCRQKLPPRSGGHIVSPRSGQYLVVYDARRVVAVEGNCLMYHFERIHGDVFRPKR